MLRDPRNIIPVSMAVLLHVVIFTSMIIGFDYARPQPLTPLVVRATLHTEIPEAPPQVPEPEPVPEPVLEDPEPEPEPEPEPDNTEELRRQAEEEKRRLDALLEQERLEKIRQQEEDAERSRKAAEEAERKKREEEERERLRQEAERKKREEEEKERLRLEAERKRQEDIRRQREENERRRREAEAAARAEEIAAEESRLAAVDSGALALYMAQIEQQIRRNWSVPASANEDLLCEVRVRQLPGGVITGFQILSCNGDDAVKRSIEAAIWKSSPLPEPKDPNLFDRNLLIRLTPE